MKTKPWIFPLLAIAALFLVITQQARSKRKIQDEIALTSLSIQELTEQTKLSQSSSSPNSQRNLISTHSNQADSRTDAEERVARILQEVLAFEIPLNDRTGGALLSILPELLPIIQDLTGHELLILCEQLEAHRISEEWSPNVDYYALNQLFLMLASEQEPEAAIASLPTLEEKTMIFSNFAHANPIAAQQWLKDADLPPAIKQTMAQSLATFLLAEDVEAWLQAQRQFQLPANRLVADLPEEKIPFLEAAFHAPENGDLRENILLTLVGSALMKNVDEARQQAERLDLHPHDLLGFFTNTNLFEDTNQGDLLDWMQDNGAKDPVIMESQIFDTTRRWADRDFEAAADWVLSKEPSATRDYAIEGFVSSVSRLDPEAAIQWTDQIQNPERQATTQEQIIEWWTGQNPDAAARWVLSTEPSPIRDQAINGLIAPLISTDPEAAMQWTDHLQSPNDRRVLEGHILKNWKTADPDAAAAWSEENTQ